MGTVWKAEDRTALKQRIQDLDPQANPHWGKMTCPEMVIHLVEALRMTFGDLPVRTRPMLVRFWPLKQLIVYVMPMPKGVPTAPELLHKGKTPDTWQQDLSDLGQLIDRFGSHPAEQPLPPHPAFGKMSRRAWGVLAYRHMNHHLTQFGV